MEFPDKPSELSKHFLKLKADETAKGVFRGKIKTSKVHWKNNRSVPCTSQTCAECTAGNKPSFRFMVNFILNDNGTYVAKIWEQGWTVYENLRALNEELPLEKNVLKITRKGSNKNDTSYIIVQQANGAVSAELEKTLAAVKLHDLDNLNETQPESASHTAEGYTEEDIPF